MLSLNLAHCWKAMDCIYQSAFVRTEIEMECFFKSVGRASEALNLQEIADNFLEI